MTLKAKWRERLIAQRKAISPERRREASLRLKEQFQISGQILSFSSIGSEIDLTPLNQLLAAEGRLHLMPYQLDSLFKTPLSQIDCILVPGLGFDRENYRIGYGQGYYDRFLAQAGDILTIGIGFKEQMCEELLPRDSWDVPVHQLILL